MPIKDNRHTPCEGRKGEEGLGKVSIKKIKQKGVIEMQSELEEKVEAMLTELETNLEEIYNQTQLLAQKVEEIGKWIVEHEHK